MAVKMNIVLPDEIAARLRDVAGEGKMSDYIARAVRSRLVEDELRALTEWEAQHGGPDLSFELGWEQDPAE
ncbi:hypothetical protein [Nocardia transvalensis]|uniref:hypothetical protein n=1 Tax=Nocardia transvalensis TaxID=37333 RepID=UPI0018935B5D|nr:hypothetical protein [Nocardia transvalensis]MBF6330251.1 hypothetical protein [Nocardia transvalensis]